MELATALSFARAHPQGVLATIRANGRPQLSNIIHLVDPEGTIRISLTDSRAKTANLRRDPRASLYVAGDTFWAYAVIEATGELSAVATSPEDPVVDELVEIYRALRGTHEDWDEYRRAMVAEGRLVLRLRPERAYGMIRDS